MMYNTMRCTYQLDDVSISYRCSVCTHIYVCLYIKSQRTYKYVEREKHTTLSSFMIFEGLSPKISFGCSSAAFLCVKEISTSLLNKEKSPLKLGPCDAILTLRKAFHCSVCCDCDRYYFIFSSFLKCLCPICNNLKPTSFLAKLNIYLLCFHVPAL